ncbi:MAG TPA: amidohydrolase, partial [Myxococcota bacterium]|nr:amidohydrolase [Myxococcota bacterium]
MQVVKLGIKRPVTRPLLPDPEPRPVRFTVISVDDHLMEPPETFEGRLPRKLQDRAPRVVET